MEQKRLTLESVRELDDFKLVDTYGTLIRNARPGFEEPRGLKIVRAELFRRLALAER